jgi:hypothetical protein
MNDVASIAIDMTATAATRHFTSVRICFSESDNEKDNQAEVTP